MCVPAWLRLGGVGGVERLVVAGIGGAKVGARHIVPGWCDEGCEGWGTGGLLQVWIEQRYGRWCGDGVGHGPQRGGRVSHVHVWEGGWGEG